MLPSDDPPAGSGRGGLRSPVQRGHAASQPVNPLQTVRNLAPSQAARYNRTALQRERIVHRLRQGPATRAELERECGAASVTKRISELRRKGFRIVGEWGEATAHDGSVNACTFYRLAVDDGAAQLPLPLE